MDSSNADVWSFVTTEACDEAFEQYYTFTPEFVDACTVAESTYNDDLCSNESSAGSSSQSNASPSPTKDFANAQPLGHPQSSAQNWGSSPLSELALSLISETAAPISAHCLGPLSCRIPSNIYTCGQCYETAAQLKQRKIERRREQNRASQRRFRALKEAKIKGGEDQIRVLEQQLSQLVWKCKLLEQEMESLRVRTLD